MKIEYDNRSSFIFENSMVKEFSKMNFVLPGELNSKEFGYFQFETKNNDEHIFIRISISNDDVQIDLGNVGEAFRWSVDDSNVIWIIEEIDKLIESILFNKSEIISVGFSWCLRVTIRIISFRDYKFWIIFNSTCLQNRKFTPWLTNDKKLE